MALVLKLQTGVQMAALRTGRNFDAGFLRIEMVTSDAVKSYFATLGVVETAVPFIVIVPQKTKKTEDQHAIEDDIESKI